MGLGALVFRPGATIVIHYHIDVVENAEAALDRLLAQFDRTGASYRYEILASNTIEIHLATTGGEVVANVEESARRIARAATSSDATVVFDQLEYGRMATHDVSTVAGQATNDAAATDVAQRRQEIQEPVQLPTAFVQGTVRPVWFYVAGVGVAAALGVLGYAFWRKSL